MRKLLIATLLLLSIFIAISLFSHDTDKKNDCKFDKEGNEINYYWCNFDNADLSGVKRHGLNFIKAHLSRANLSNSDIQYSRFNEADLSFANFQNSDLSFAVFVNANIADADFKNAKLNNAIWIDYEICDTGSVGGCKLKPQDGLLNEILINLAINYPDFRTLTGSNWNNMSTAPTLTMLVNKFVSKKMKLYFIGKPVEFITEQEAIEKGFPGFFEIINISTENDSATLNYGFPKGAHRGDIYFKKIDGRWKLKSRNSIRDSYYGRSRLKEIFKNKRK